MGRLGACLLAALLLACASSAYAQPSSSTDDRARELFQSGADALGAGRYEEALQFFRAAYELSGRPGLLYNIALAHDRLRQDAEALRTYEQYLAEAGEVQNRAEVQRRVEILRRSLESRGGSTAQTSPETRSNDAPAAGGTAGESTATGAAPGVVLTPAGSTADDGGGPGVLPWVAIAGGGALAVGGAVLLGVGLSDSSSVEDAPDGAMWSDFENRASRGGTFQTVGTILLITGVVGAAAGVTLLVLGSSDSDDDAPMYVRLGPGNLTLTGTF